MIDLATRRVIVEDTIARSAEIASSTPGGSLDSTFVSISDLPALSKTSPKFPNLQLKKPIQILDSDTFAAGRAILFADPNQRGKLAVLNLANDQQPGGGWRYTLSTTQEEALCYSSTLYVTLKPECYPWPNKGPGSAAGIYSPNIVVFRDTLDNDLRDLPIEDRYVVSVITAAAPCVPKLTEDGLDFAIESDVEGLREKVRFVLRCAAYNEQSSVVLGAWGCGAFQCPPGVVAREMRSVLEEDEFEGWFENVVFAVYGRGPTGRGNLEAFRNEFGT